MPRTHHTHRSQQSTICHVHLDIYLAICKPADSRDPIHWMILLVRPGDSRCTWLHCVGYSGRMRYSHECNKRFDSHGITEKYFLGQVLREQAERILLEAGAVPEQSCQSWALGMIYRLERLRYLPVGSHDTWRDHHLRTRDPHRPRQDLGPGIFAI